MHLGFNWHGKHMALKENKSYSALLCSCPWIFETNRPDVGKVWFRWSVRVRSHYGLLARVSGRSLFVALACEVFRSCASFRCTHRRHPLVYLSVCSQTFACFLLLFACLLFGVLVCSVCASVHFVFPHFAHPMHSRINWHEPF